MRRDALEQENLCAEEARRLNSILTTTLVDKGYAPGPGLRAEAERLVKRHRQRCKSEGIDFPELTVIVLPWCGQLLTFRRDLDARSIRNVIKRIVMQYSPVHVEELAEAVREAWPGYKPEESVIDLSAASGGVQ